MELPGRSFQFFSFCSNHCHRGIFRSVSISGRAKLRQWKCSFPTQRLPVTLTISGEQPELDTSSGTIYPTFNSYKVISGGDPTRTGEKMVPMPRFT